MSEARTKPGAKIAPSGDTGATFSDLNDNGEPSGPNQELKFESNPLWPKKTFTNETSGQNTQSEKTSSAKRTLTFTGVATSLKERSGTRRMNFWIKVLGGIASFLWNVASPIKAYMLSYYGLPGDDLVFSHNLNWTMEVDYQYAKALYDMSGVKYTAPTNQPIRFMNMYLDFVVFNRADKWAQYIDDFQQDPYIGLFCRTSLVPKGQKIIDQMLPFCNNPYGYFGSNNMMEGTSCRVNEVSEAVMCLKGINVSQLLNYEWQSGLDPTNPYIMEGARRYQDTVFPDLDACLARRELLVKKSGRDEALNTLAHELAKNYTLDPIGFGGKRGLYNEYRYYEGFKDLSGKPSGVRYSKMSGSLPERTQPVEADLNALVMGRERLWWIVSYTPEQFRDQVVDLAYYAPYMWTGMFVANRATAGRFIDRYTIQKAGPKIGICQNWNQIPTSFKTYPDPIYLNTTPQSSVLTAYSSKFFGVRTIAENNVTSAAEVARIFSRMSTLCISRDGCMDLCTVQHSTSWLATFNRAGLCQEREVQQNVIHRHGFVDWQCMGEGTGSDTFSVLYTEPVLRSDGTNFTQHFIKNIADPGAIVACVLGGRIPQKGDEPFPNVFFDLIKNGPNTIVTTTFSRGTEKVLVNVYALVSLVGCTVFAVWVVQNTKNVLRMLQRVKTNGLCDRVAFTQLIDSVATVNLSTVSHGRNIQLSKVILWLNLVTWYIGASESYCTWWVDGVDLWTPGYDLKTSDSPYYKCKPGHFSEFMNSFLGIVRVLSISYNFYSLTCQHLILRGATRYVLPFLSPILFFGVLPTLLASAVITGINHARLEFGILADFHNQLFLVVLWVLYLFGYHWMLQNGAIGRHLVGVLVRFNLAGKQTVKPGSVAEAIIGPYYLTMPSMVREEATEWIPLSVALEAPTFDLNKVDFSNRTYSLTNPVKGEHTRPTPVIPDWVKEDDEFFFC